MRSRSEGLQEFSQNQGKSVQDLFNAPMANAIDTLEIVLGHLCQMKCLYCSEQFSSSWAKENFEFNESTIKTNSNPAHREIFKKSFFDYLPEALKTVSHIHFIGGEPLIQNEFYAILDQVLLIVRKIERQKPLEINVISNLSISESHMNRFYDLLKNQPSQVRINLLPSIEGVGPKAEYARYGLNWSLFDRNLKMALLSEQFSEIKILSTLNILTLPGLKEFFLYLDKLPNANKINLRFNYVNGRPVLSPDILGDSVLPFCEEAIRALGSEVKNLLKINDAKEFLMDFANSLRGKPVIISEKSKLEQFLNRMDLRRGTNFENVFPELSDLLKIEASQKGKELL